MKNTNSSSRAKVTWTLILSGRMQDIDKVGIKAIIDRLRQLLKSKNLDVCRIEAGSVKLMIQSTRRCYERAKSLYDSGEFQGVLTRRVLGIRLDAAESAPKTSMIKVLFADDHAVVRRGLKQIINDEPDLEVAAEAQNAQECLEMAQESYIDVIILDITLPDKNGLVVLQEIKATRPTLPVLILSMHPEDQFALRALKLGAAGYLTKETAPGELVSALRKVLGGGKYISARLAEQLVSDIGSSASRPAPETLSEREFQVLQLIASGKTISQIAGQLELDVKTIST